MDPLGAEPQGDDGDPHTLGGNVGADDQDVLGAT